MHRREKADGKQDGLEPLEALDVGRATTCSELLRQMGKTAFGARTLGEAYEVLLAMARDPDCHIVVTLSGAMTVAKMGKVLCDMIDHGLAHSIVSTGALMAHGLTEAIGHTHYKYDPTVGDQALYERGYNRVYDTLEMESNFDSVQDFVSVALRNIGADEPTCSSEIHREIGRLLVEAGQMPSVLGCAYRQGVKVYVPAFTDSELGLDAAVLAMQQVAAHDPGATTEDLFSSVPSFNPFLDLNAFASEIARVKRVGIFTIGGGVPRNWGQQVGPYIENINLRVGRAISVPRMHYGIRICPEPVHWGGLSGCTYTEGVSWGKFVPVAEGGRFAEVYCDATIAWPLLIRGVLETRGDVS